MSSHERNLLALQIAEDVFEVFFQLIKGLTLGHIIRVRFEVAHPHTIYFLPVNDFDRFHFLFPHYSYLSAF